MAIRRTLIACARARPFRFARNRSGDAVSPADVAGVQCVGVGGRFASSSDHEQSVMESLSNLYAHALSSTESQRLEEAKAQAMKSNVDDWVQKNWHFRRTLAGLKGPNHYGIHMPMLAYRRFNRGARSNWGSLRRSITRLQFRYST
eukprot:TRINITY_DN68306_c0_g1_i1.p1 TRINITY_DN68306_c0_g1~~TRINITY_DN68306_c0_g1_i1.p1  ORF type:complete len:146 (+),score=10.06 TRINITY_DN68306_c0_g1_i1:101-538(+)